MIFLTKRIRAYRGLKLIKEFGAGRIVDVGSGDNFFVNKLKGLGYDADGLELERGKDFLKMRPEKASIITGLALLWHIDVKKFFNRCKRWDAERIILIQGNGLLEPITRMYSIGHKHEVTKICDIIDFAGNEDYVLIGFRKGLLWFSLVFEKRSLIQAGFL